MREGAGSDGCADDIRRLGIALEQRESLLRAVSDIAGRMLELGSWEGIEDSLRVLGQCTGVQRVSIMENWADDTGGVLMSLRHEWSDSNVEPQLGKPQWIDMSWPAMGLGRWQHSLEAGRPLAVTRSTVPPEELRPMASQGILALAAVPIEVQGEWWGSLVFDDCLTERVWSDAELDALQTASRLFASFILRLRNGQSLRESEARYRGIVQALPDMIFRVDEEMRFTDVQSAHPEDLLLPPEGVLGRSFSEILPPDVAVRAERQFRATLATGVMQILEYSLEIGGELRHYESRLVPCSDREMVAIVRDVTGAREAEHRLRDSEARFRSIVQTLPDFIFRIDDKGRFTDVQAASPERLLVPAGEAIGRTPAEILPPDGAALAEKHFAAAFATGEMQVYDYRLDVRGEIFDYEIRIMPCTERELLAIVRDVTGAREAERRLRESEARYMAVVNDQTELVCRFGTDSVLSFVNDAYCRYFGRTEEELIGKRFMPMVPEDDQDLVNYMFSSLSSASPILVYEHRVYDGRGDLRWVEWTDRAIIGADGGIVEYQSVGRDVTERRELHRRLLGIVEEEQKRLAQELHDGLCQDLKGLEIEAALLEDRLAGADADTLQRAAEVGRHANMAVRSAYHIVRGMLPVGLDARGLVPALNMLAQRAREHAGCRVICSLQEDLLPISEIQASHLYKIAQEALGNAMRHAHAGEIRIDWGLEEGLAVLSVRDDGVGFDTDGPRWENRGVGLTVLESRAQAIGSRLRVESRPGGGTEVRCLVNDWVVPEGRCE